MTAQPDRPTRLSRLACGLALALGCIVAAPSDLWAQSLEDTLVTAYVTSPTLLAARAQLKAVNEGVPQELSNWRPQVTVNGSVGKGHTDFDSDQISEQSNTTPLEAGIGFRQSLYRGGRTLAGTSRAEADVRAQRASLHSTEQEVLLSASTAYMDVWRDQSVLQLTIKNEQVLRRQLEASRDRFEVGEITRTDVAQSESRLARATAERIASEGELSSSRATFKEAIGVFPGLLEEPPPIVSLTPTRKEVVGAAVAENPDVVAAEFNEQSARHQVRVSVGELLPEVSLSGDATYSEDTRAEGSEVEEYLVQAQVSIPLYQQGLVSSLVRESKQVASQRRIQVDEALRSAEQRAITSWEDLETARAQIVSFRAQVAAAQVALEGVRQENAVGARTILDILDAEQELLDGQVSLVRVQRDEQVAGYSVRTAMGRLTAARLGLPVEIYDPVTDYRAVRNKWFGLSGPGD